MAWSNVKSVRANELYYTNILKKMELQKKYNMITQKCYDEIKNAAYFGKDYCFFCVPFYIYNFPDYDIGYFIRSLTLELRKNDYWVSFIIPNTLFISWVDIKKLIDKREIRTFLKNETEKTLKLFHREEESTEETLRSKHLMICDEGHDKKLHKELRPKLKKKKETEKEINKKTEKNGDE